MKALLKTLLIIPASAAGFMAVTAAAYMPFVIATSCKKYDDDCDCLIILGGDIIGAETPSPQLFERMKGAAEYLKKHPDTLAVPCGGCFRKEQKKSEAQIIAEYLVSQGIDSGRITLEDKSETTFQNFDNAMPIIAENTGVKNVKLAFLTSSYHIFRAGAIARICGIENLGKVSVLTPGEAFKRFVREYFCAYQLPIEYFRRKKQK